MFDHERLIVYQRALAFTAWAAALLQRIGACGSVRDQLDRASTGIPLNIAEGNGKYSPKDRVRFLDIAQGSALECAAALDVIVAKGKATEDEVDGGKEMVLEIVNRLVRLRMSVLERLSEPKSSDVLREGGEQADGWFPLWELEPYEKREVGV